MYKALVRSQLNYCDIIYHIPSHQNQAPLGVTLNSLMEKVERIQYQSALDISGAWQGSSRTKLYEELGWESLADAISSWNSFIKHFDGVPSFDILKKHINTFFRPKINNLRYT